MASDSGGRAVPHRRRAFKAGAKLRLLAVVYAALLVAATLLPIRWEPGLVRYPGDDYRPQLVPLCPCSSHGRTGEGGWWRSGLRPRSASS